jgi:type VI secretion system protein ImpJ
MVNAMNEKAGIYWQQGMFLQPQHFQQSDLHQQFQRKPSLESSQPHFWGIGELTLATAAIANQRIELQSAHVLFPDRIYVEYPGNAVVAQRAFTMEQFQGDKPLTVYLGLRRLHATEPNVTTVGELGDAALASTRYASTYASDEVPDLYSNAPPAQVHSLMFVLRIFLESELETLQDYELVPIASLVRDGSLVRLVEDFVPPCYALSGSQSLKQQIRDIRDELAGRARQLQAYKSPGGMQRAGLDAADLVFLLGLRTMNRFSPQLQHLSEDENLHPWAVYGVLRQLVGELSSFSERFNMFGEADDGTAGVPPYDHRQIGRCFARAHALISHMLNEITVGAEFIVQLKLEGQQYLGELPKRLFGEHNRFYLLIHSDASREAIAQGVLKDARLGPTGDMPKLLSLALPGLELIHLPVAPQGLPRRPNSHYFRIEQISRQWESVTQDGLLSLVWLDAPADLRADIAVVRR